MAAKRQKSLDLFGSEPENQEQPVVSSPAAEPRGSGAGVTGSAVGVTPTSFAAASPADYNDLNGKRVFVIDSHSLIYQVFHAISEMTAPDGRPVNAIYGFLRDILDILNKRQPDFLFCAFDRSEVTFRNDIYPEYKAHRDPMPEALRSQIPEIQRLLRALAIPVLDLEGFEADDILATIARVSSERGGECFLVTSDKDCRQLINDKVHILNMRKNLVYGAEQLLADWGIRPDQVVDYQSMVGDSVDNVPGIPTIGPKTATQLLNQFQTLDEVLSRTHEIPGKKGEKIRDSAELAHLSRRLVALANDVPIEIDWHSGQLGRMNVPEAVKICQELGFRSLTEQVGKLAPRCQAVASWQCDYETLSSLDRLKEIVQLIIKAGKFSFDTETTAISPRWAKLVGISLAWETGQAVYIPIRSPEPDRNFLFEDVWAVLSPIFQDPAVEMIGQNLKYDLVILRNSGKQFEGPLFDTMVADYLINPGRNTHNMDELSSRILGHETIKISELIGSGKTAKTMDQVPLGLITDYAAEDADVPWRLEPILNEQLGKQGLDRLFRDVEMPLVLVLAEMEFNGIAVDRDVLKTTSRKFSDRLSDLTDQIFQMAGEPFNIDSPQQLGKVLFEKIGLKRGKKIKTGYSTDADVLAELADEHPLPAAIIEYRQLSKLKNTYTDVLCDLIHPETGRVHTSFMQDVARTGRLSSKDPNLQNIPIRTEEGQMVRRAFVASRADTVIMTADYSQIELRVLAHFCGDQALSHAFATDQDIHAAVAAQVYGVSLQQVSSEMRRRAKAINFGIIYGQSPFGLARELGISKDEASKFIDDYFSTYPSVSQFMRDTLKKAAKDGYVTTILGRRRPVDGVRDPDSVGSSKNRSSSERIAINTVIQGSAADLIKLAMVDIYRSLRHTSIDAQLLLQIHDELLFEVKQDHLVPLARLVADKMTQAMELSVPLKVVIEAGNNWNDTEEVNWRVDNV